MTDIASNDRRYFPRVNYRAHATLVTSQNRWPVHLLDLSFNGALVALINKHNLIPGETIILNIELHEGDIIKLQGTLSHIKEHYLGLECRATGIDNQARLRELLEKFKSKEADLAERSYASLLDSNNYDLGD
ncbi:PilZ domain-containing protein [Aurantivibrio plasticivorans]